MITVTPDEIDQYRSVFSDSPEVLDALNLIEENNGDLEKSAILLAQESGIQIVRADDKFLKKLAKKFCDIVCDKIFINDLMTGALSAAVAPLTATGQIPEALAFAVVIYLAKIGIRKFCNSTHVKPKTP